MTFSLTNVTRVTWIKIGLLLAFLMVNVALYKQSSQFQMVVASFFSSLPAQNVANTRNVTGSSPPNATQSPASFRPGNFTTDLFPLTPSNDLSTIPPKKNPTHIFKSKKTLAHSTARSAPYPKVMLEKHPFLNESIVNPHNFNYRIFPSFVCDPDSTELVIAVPITRSNFEGRKTVRETWGSFANTSGNNAILVFFIGSEHDSDSEVQTKIQNEAAIFGDILQEQYIDSYNNLSLKSVSILKWVNFYCPRSSLVLKADDDMYINVPLLVRTLKGKAASSETPSAFVMGSEQWNAHPIRNTASKWYTPYTMFKGDTYPNYMSGTAYAMTTEAAKLLYEASLRVPLFWLEDIYITGLCAKKSHVTLVNSDMFSYGKPDASGCSFRNHISGHRYKLEEISKIHKELYDPNTVCERAAA
ncbi:unnamed protein product [Lymnaea stagnalis]|uniref:Hexosyltransferase n=1 Tax=Lymnaea stagnalis TaxID=6523 RepID=A0AAV2INZ7_LYMST